jgi:arabinoxylan arabinofuranohydrolase
MKKMKRKKFLTAILWTAVMAAHAQNPIIQTCFTPDPAPFVHGDTVYLFTDHDEDDAQYFKMKDWLLFSTTDMVNWTFRGVPLSTETFKWAKQGDNAWASQAVERDGKWYWYVAAEDTTVHLHGVGVAVADRPEGPYRDAIGKPLVPGGWGYIDPSVFVDDDGQAYLFWGNNGLWYAKLGRDMVSLASDIIQVNIEDTTAFGPKVMKHDYALNKKVPKDLRRLLGCTRRMAFIIWNMRRAEFPNIGLIPRRRTSPDRGPTGGGLWTRPSAASRFTAVR